MAPLLEVDVSPTLDLDLGRLASSCLGWAVIRVNRLIFQDLESTTRGAGGFGSTGGFGKAA
jgi:hypothetical protein